MSEEHGSTTITAWLQDLVRTARSAGEFDVSAGAEPDRRYAYLEYHGQAQHSILLFRAEESDAGPEVKTYRFDGESEEVRNKVHALTHAAF